MSLSTKKLALTAIVFGFTLGVRTDCNRPNPTPEKNDYQSVQENPRDYQFQIKDSTYKTNDSSRASRAIRNTT